MNRDSDDSNDRKLVGYCCYCKREIYEGEGYVFIEGKGLYHYDKHNDLLNCYYEENE